MEIYYWSPYLTNIATIKSVVRSAKSLGKFGSKKYNATILDSCGEWKFLKKNNFKVKIKSLVPFNFYNILPKEGFIQSRLSFIIIFIFNFFPLLFKMRKNKPEYLIIHLLTLLPIILSPLIYKKTKIILRISGLPKLNFFRRLIWKFFSNFLFAITTPTTKTYNMLKQSGIFNEKKIKMLRDPIIENSEINEKKKIQIDSKLRSINFYLSIGRLTKQKNFNFLVNFFCRNKELLKDKKLAIIGEGEDRAKLERLIKNNKMEEKIYLLGFKENVYNYIFNCHTFISTAEYEDPGFALIESAFLRKKIISSLVDNGPKEMFDNGNICYFFNPNNTNEFLNAINLSKEDSKIKKIRALKYSKNFTIFSHFNELRKILT